jgi:hypothetical protein
MKEYRIDFSKENKAKPRALILNDEISMIEAETDGYISAIRMNKSTTQKVIESMGIEWVKPDGSLPHKDTVVSDNVVVGSYCGYAMDIDDEIEDDVAIITYDTEEE